MPGPFLAAPVDLVPLCRVTSQLERGEDKMATCRVLT